MFSLGAFHFFAKGSKNTKVRKPNYSPTDDKTGFGWNYLIRHFGTKIKLHINLRNGELINCVLRGNIYLLNILPYCPELNPCEQIG